MLDRYSKAVLTVIAATLVGLLVQNAIKPAGANDGVQRVVICDTYDYSRCARVIRAGGYGDDNSNYLLSK